MYRTEEWYEKLKGNKLKTPVCIPSYHRPDAPIFSSKLLKELSREEVFVFIRHDAEQMNLYSKLNEKFTLVLLPEVHDIGDTRREIVNWAYKNGYENIFLFDDRVQEVNTLTSKITRNGNPSMSKSKFSTAYGSLLIWEYLQNTFPTTISTVSPKGYSWYPENINREFTVNVSSAAYVYICLNVKDVIEHDINYISVEDGGLEDLRILYNIMKLGLPARRFTDLEALEFSTKNVTSISGANAINPNVTRTERLQRLRKLFFEKTLGLPDLTKTEEFKILNNKEHGKYLLPNWKYWEEYYKLHKIK